MVASTASFRHWSAEVQPLVIRQFDEFLYCLRAMDSPSRLVVFMTVTVFCYVALQSARPKPACRTSTVESRWATPACPHQHPVEEGDGTALVELPKAFSVREEDEFRPIRQLMARLNPKLMVTQAGTGVQADGACTVFWGVVHLEDRPPSKTEVEAALVEAGFDTDRNASTAASELWTG